MIYYNSTGAEKRNKKKKRQRLEPDFYKIVCYHVSDATVIFKDLGQPAPDKEKQPQNITKSPPC